MESSISKGQPHSTVCVQTLDILLQCSEFNDDVLSISYRKVLILSLPT